MNRKKITLLIIAAAMSLTALAGCGSQRKAGDFNTFRAMEPTDASVEAEWEEGAPGGGDASIGNKRVALNSAVSANKANSAEAQEAASGSGQSQANVDPAKGRLLIRTVQMSAETKEFDKVRESVESKIKELGGYIENSGISGTGKAGSLRTANYTIRVPANGLDALISSVGSNCTVTSTNEITTDVTLNYVDTKARLDSLRIEQQQLTELLSQAKDLDTIIVLQKRITEVRYEIESAESTLRVLENQVTYSTLSLKIREVVEIKPQEEPHVPSYGEKIAETFKDSLKNVGDFFKGLLLVIVALSPVIVIALVIAAIVLAIVFGARKKRRARAAKAAAAKANAQTIPAQAVPVQNAVNAVPVQAPAQAPVQAPAQTAPAQTAPVTAPEKKEDNK